MKEWRKYQCEGYDDWETLSDINSSFDTCPDGNDPVMIMRSKPSERLTINIVPLAREMNNASKKIGLTNLYKIELISLVDNLRLLSRRSLDKEETLLIVASLIGLEKAATLRVWKAKKL